MSKVYIIFTIETEDSGENFTIEKVFSNFIESIKYKLYLEFKYNTEYYPEKDNTKWKQEYNNLLSILNKTPSINEEEFNKIYENFHKCFDEFSKNKTDTSGWDLPHYNTIVKEMTIDNYTENERKTYGYC